MSELTIELNSVRLHGPTVITVILPDIPAGKEPGEYYTGCRCHPVLWLLHGGLNGGRDWLRGSNVARFCLERGIMAVIPNAPNSDFANHPEYADGFFFQDFFFDELMPFVRGYLHGSARREDNFIAGYSMGCNAAWMYGLAHPEEFGGVIPLSSAPLDYRFLEPYRALTGPELRRAAAEDPVTFHSAYGAPGPLRTKELNLIAKHETVGDFLDSGEHTRARFDDAAAEGTLPRVYLTGSLGDAALAELRRHALAIGAKDVAFDLRDGPAHSFAFWDDAIRRGMDHFAL